MKHRFIPVLVLAGALAFASCGDLDDLQKRVDSLESRVDALTTQVSTLNKNIEAMSALMENGTIKSVVEASGVYTITLSNGQELTVSQGSTGVANAPIMSVDKDGYWMVDYQDGKGATYILQNGEKVQAKGSDGITPVFGVNASGNWTVSYDGGKTSQEVLGADGKPVSALPSGEVTDPYFKSVDYNSTTGIFTLVLKDGTSIQVPVVNGFQCSISGAEGTQVFNYGETKTYAVTLEGVAQSLVFAPTGWTASISGSVFTVTAPVATKSVEADNSKDVSILAVSTTGYTSIAKMKVELDGTPVVVNPVAVVTISEVGTTTAAFTVALSDADSWKYMVLKASETAPEASYINENGTAGTGTSASLTGLESGTDYVVYAVAVNGTTLSAVAKASFTTKEEAVTDLYTAYEAGKTVTIAGTQYSKAVNGASTLLSASAAKTDLRVSIHQKSGVFFLEQTDGASFDIPSVCEITGDVVLISRYTDKRATLAPTMCSKLKSGSYVLKNIDVDMTSINGGTNAGYLLNNANATADFGSFILDGCRFTNVQKPLMYLNVATYGITKMVVENCTFSVVATANIQLFNLYKSSVLDKYKEITFEDNVFCSTTGNGIQVVNYDQNVAQTGTAWECKLNVNHNIFYNCPGLNGYFKFYQLAGLTMNWNVFWAEESNANASYGFITYSSSQAADVVNLDNNIFWGLSKQWYYAHTNSTMIPSTNIATRTDASPFKSFDKTTLAYTLETAYSAYGPRN